MSKTPILKIKSNEGEIKVVAKMGNEMSIKPINLKFIMATLWWEGAPELETFFNVLELSIKRALSEVYPHQKMTIDYTYTANDALEEASEILVEIDQVYADQVRVEVERDIIKLRGSDERGFFSKLTSYKRKVEKKVHKEI